MINNFLHVKHIPSIYILPFHNFAFFRILILPMNVAVLAGLEQSESTPPKKKSININVLGRMGNTLTPSVDLGGFSTETNRVTESASDHLSFNRFLSLARRLHNENNQFHTR